jgi:hypothetical protein
MRATSALRSARVNFHSNGRAMLSKWHPLFGGQFNTVGRAARLLGLGGFDALVQLRHLLHLGERPAVPH